MKLILKIKSALDQAIGYFVGFILLIMALTITFAVIDRYIGGSIAWVEELVRAGVVWTTFLGSYVAITRNKDIRVDMFVKKFPPLLQDLSKIISDILVLMFLVVFVPLAFSYTAQFASYKLPMTGMTRGVLYAVFPFGGIMMAIHYVLSVILSLQSIVKRHKDKEGEAV